MLVYDELCIENLLPAKIVMVSYHNSGRNKNYISESKTRCRWIIKNSQKTLSIQLIIQG